MSKIKIAVVSIIVVGGLAAAVVMQQQKINALHQENDGLKQQAAQVAPLQEQLAHAQDAANAGVAEQQETQTHELARLRNEVIRLRGTTNELAKARREIQTLNQRVASEREAGKGQVAAVLAETQQKGNMYACINNLRLIDSAKQQWALEQRKTAADTPAVEDLTPYLGTNGVFPACPSGGVYTIGTVGERPVCNIPGHALP